MCTLEVILDAATSIVSTAISIKSNHEQKLMADFQNKQLIKEAKNTVNNAKYEIQEGIEESRRKKLKSILNMGEEKSNIASGNIALSSQTAINIVDDEKLNGELDALNTLKSSEHKAERYFQQADSLYANAALNTFYNRHSYVNKQASAVVGLIGHNRSNIDDFLTWRKENKKED